MSDSKDSANKGCNGMNTRYCVSHGSEERKTGWVLRGLYFLLLGAIAFLLFSCATTGEVYRTNDEIRAAGVWHRVEEGQTLWRIAKTYRVSL